MSERSAVTTHVLDTALGRPARGVPVRLERVTPSAPGVPEVVAEALTDDDGRVVRLGPDRLAAATYRLVLGTAEHFAATAQACFFPEVAISFELTDPTQHHHVPVLLSPFAYSTYRGS